MTNAEQTIFWHKWNRFQQRYERIFAPKYNRALREQINQFIEAGTLMAVNSEPIYKVTFELYTTVSPIWAAASSLNLRRQKARAPMGFSQFIVDQMRIFYGIDFLNMSDEITQTTKDVIQAVLNDAALEGFGFDEVVRRLASAELTRYRARLIARTETTGAANAAGNIAAIKTGLVYDKIWIAAKDARTRRTHKLHTGVDGTIVGMNEKFIVGGMPMDFPGDKNGGAAQVCNCFLPDQLTSVNPNIINKAFRSVYNGKVVTIKASNGNRFTCTPNHPILTSNGFIAAGKLEKFDKLIYSSFINDNLSPNFNVNDGHSTFEQMYNSLLVNGVSMRKAGVVMDFYGDGSNSDVDIVCVNSKLHNRKKLRKFVSNKLFQNSDFNKAGLFFNSSFRNSIYSLLGSTFFHGIISTLNKFKSIFMGGFTHSNIHTFAPVLLGDPEAIKPVNNNISTTSNNAGDFFNRKFIIKHLDDLINVNDCANIISITHSDYSGYVYTFETTEQMYDINSFVAKNCRCACGQIPKRDKNGRLIRI